MNAPVEQSDKLLQTLQQMEQTGVTPTDDKALHALLLALLREVTALRDETETLRAMVRNQDQHLAQLVNSPRQPTRRYKPYKPQAPVQPPMQRPLEYWATNLPDLGEDLTQEEIQRHLTRPWKQAEISGNDSPNSASPQRQSWWIISPSESSRGVMLFQQVGLIILLLGGIALIWLTFF